MGDDSMQERADRRLEQALGESHLADPRPHYRARLRRLKERDPAVFEEALRHYETTVVERIASEDGDPVAAWLEFGRMLAELSPPGRLMEIDAHGRAHRFYASEIPEHLVLHLPDDEREPPMVLALPADPSPAQRATYDLLVDRRQELR